MWPSSCQGGRSSHNEHDVPLGTGRESTSMRRHPPQRLARKVLEGWNIPVEHTMIPALLKTVLLCLAPHTPCTKQYWLTTSSVSAKQLTRIRAKDVCFSMECRSSGPPSSQASNTSSQRCDVDVAFRVFNWHDTSVRESRAHVRSGIHSTWCFQLFHIALGSDKSKKKLGNCDGRSKYPWSNQNTVRTISSFLYTTALCPSRRACETTPKPLLREYHRS